jgi:hypothetical protein
VPRQPGWKLWKLEELFSLTPMSISLSEPIRKLTDPNPGNSSHSSPRTTGISERARPCQLLIHALNAQRTLPLLSCYHELGTGELPSYLAFTDCNRRDPPDARWISFMCFVFQIKVHRRIVRLLYELELVYSILIQPPTLLYLAFTEYTRRDPTFACASFFKADAPRSGRRMHGAVP